MAFNNCKAHRCKDWCNICGRSQCTKIDEEITSTSCNAPCRSHECLNAHQNKIPRQTHSMCEQMMFCPICKVKLNKYKMNGWDLSMHTCGETYCSNCKTLPF